MTEHYYRIALVFICYVMAMYVLFDWIDKENKKPPK